MYSLTIVALAILVVLLVACIVVQFLTFPKEDEYIKSSDKLITDFMGTKL